MRRSLLRGPVVACLLATGLASAPAAGAATQSQTEATLKAVMRGMPSGTSAYAHEAATNTTLAARSATTKRIPASVTKLFTTATALMLDGPSARLTTELRMTGTLGDDGVLDGDLILRGAGDPTLTLAGITSLAKAAKDAGIEQIGGELRADMAGWTAQQGTPLTGGAYNREIGGRLGPLVTLRGFASASVTDPARQVLVRLRDALRAGGLRGGVTFGAPGAADAGATLVGKVSSPTMAQIAAATNAPSDNFYAEMLLRGTGARHGGAGTTVAGLAAQRTALATIGVRPTLADGSGLSRGNRVAPTTIVKLLDQMSARPEGAALRNGMALAGATGTVAGRMRGTAAAGRCRVKTGTLSNVSALAGWCTTLGKRTVSFAVLMNRVSVARARGQQDRFAAAIAGWSDPVKTVIEPVEPPATTPGTTPAATTPGAPVAAGGGVSSAR